MGAGSDCKAAKGSELDGLQPYPARRWLVTDEDDTDRWGLMWTWITPAWARGVEAALVHRVVPSAPCDAGLLVGQVECS